MSALGEKQTPKMRRARRSFDLRALRLTAQAYRVGSLRDDLGGLVHHGERDGREHGAGGDQGVEFGHCLAL